MDDLSVVTNMGSFQRHINTYKRIKQRNKIDILALGGSITAGGYYHEFVRLLEKESKFQVVVHNHGHGATGERFFYLFHLYFNVRLSTTINCFVVSIL